MPDCSCIENEEGLTVSFCRDCAALLTQRTPEWYQARCGYATASRAIDITATTQKGLPTYKHGQYMDHLIAERLTGRPQGIRNIRSLDARADMEPEARTAYSFYTDREVVEVGFIHHLFVERFGASPDGLVGSDGMIEIKNLDPAQHIKLLSGGAAEETILSDYRPQLYSGLACTDREWCDFVSYCPAMLEEEHKIYVKTFWRDEGEISKIENAVKVFLAELEAKVEAVRARTGRSQGNGFESQLVESLKVVKKSKAPKKQERKS